MDHGTLIGLISAGVIALFLIGVPVFLVIGFWVVGVSLAIDFTLANIGVTLFEGLNFFGLLSLPLFILTGDLIAAAGIARRLGRFCACLFELGARWHGYGHHRFLRLVCCHFRVQFGHHRHHRRHHAPSCW